MKFSKTAVIATIVFLASSAFCIVGKTGSAPKVKYNDGTYKVTVQGRNAPIELEMVVSNGKPSAVNVLAEEESFFAQPAEGEIIKAFLKGKSVDEIDAISGATETSNAMKSGIKNLLGQALPEASQN